MTKCDDFYDRDEREPLTYAECNADGCPIHSELGKSLIEGLTEAKGIYILKERIAELEVDLESATDGYLSSLHAIDEYKRRIAELEAQNATHIKNVHHCLDEHVELRRENKELQAENTQLKEDLEEMVRCNEINLKTIDSLCKTDTERAYDVEYYQRMHKTAEDQSKWAAAQLVTCREENATLKAQYDTCCRERAEAEDKLYALTPKPVVTSVWRNVYEFGLSTNRYLSRAEAVNYADGDALGILRLDTCNGVTTCELERI